MAIFTPNPFYVYLHEKDVIVLNIVDDFEKNSARGDYTGHFPGVVRPLLKWNTLQVDDLTIQKTKLVVN